MHLQTLNDVLEHSILDLYSAEMQLVDALPKMARAASSSKLKEGFEEHLVQTREHVTRLEEVAAELHIELPGPRCVGMEGLIKEGAKLMEEESGPALDAALIAAAQRVEHYEIAGYGSAIVFAKTLKEDKAADTLKKTMGEEEATDKKLSKLAESDINKAAATE